MATVTIRTVSIVCLDATTGDERWREMGFGCGSLMLADDTLIVLSDQGELLFAPASPDAFTPLSRGEALDGKCWSVPVLVRKRIYCRNADGRLVCVNVELKPSAASVALLHSWIACETECIVDASIVQGVCNKLGAGNS